jgi:hypothetical protein
MTIEQIRDAWLRWLHRKDVAADLDTVQALAESMIKNTLLQDEPDLTLVLASAPGAYLHGGLVYLHELAQDSDGLALERELYAAAIGDYAMRSSLSSGPKQAARPY